MKVNIFDLDGTLACPSPFDERQDKYTGRRDTFLKTIAGLPLAPWYESRREQFSATVNVIMTGRPTWMRPVTIEWLQARDVQQDAIFFIPNDGEHEYYLHEKISVIEEMVRFYGPENVQVHDDDAETCQYLSKIPGLVVHHYSKGDTKQ